MEEFKWWQDGIIYQVYPRSFSDSNNDGIGDLTGIMNRLDYFSNLDIDAIWLSPIYPSPDVDFGYDVSDYYAIDPRYGTMQDFDRLLVEAHRKNIRIILDMVLNHTSDKHPWFQQSRLSRENAYSDWYLWRDPLQNGKPPNNWQSRTGGGGWEFDPQRGQYYFHMFYKQQPDLNWRNPEVCKAMMDILHFWLEKGVDGFRFDVFNVFYKDKNFSNNPPKLGIRKFDCQQHVFDCDQPEMIPVLEEIRSLMDGYGDRFSVGEPFLSTPEKAAKYSAPGRLNTAFNFDFLTCPWKPDKFLQTILNFNQILETESWPTCVLNNHDTRRSASRFTRGEDDRLLKAAAALLLTQRGTPFLYYGEEIGMRDVQLQKSEIKDPVGLHYWPFYKGRDGCRSPMQWDASENGGFSKASPWMKVHSDYPFRNIADQQENSTSLFNFYRRLIQLRKENEALRRGAFIPLTFIPRKILAYLRQTEKQTIIVVINFSWRPIKFFLGSGLAQEKWRLMLSSKREELDNLKKNIIELGAFEATILEQSPTHGEA
jgi:alpha-glucosidase